MIQITVRPIDQVSLPKVIQADGVSLTANATGFTPLASVASAYGWRGQDLIAPCDECNRRQEICVLSHFKPQAFLVPRTRGRAQDDFLISDLVDACEQQAISRLHFTHYFFILDEFPEREINIILEHLRKRHVTALQEIIFDIDSKFDATFRSNLHSIFGAPAC